MISYLNKLNLIVFVFVFGFFNLALADHEPYEFSPEKPYYVTPNPSAEENSEKQAINKGGYYGYRIYHQNCHVCHGKAARGSSFAPNLLESYKHVKGS